MTSPTSSCSPARRLGTCLLTSLALVLPGCSFGMVEAPSGPLIARPVCDVSYRRPGADVAAAALLALPIIAVGALAGAVPNGGGSGSVDGGVIVLGLVPLVIFGAAAAHGFASAGRCREQQASWGAHPAPVAAGAHLGACRPTLPQCDAGLRCEDHVCVNDD
jgi:hypothetical protein